MSPNNVYRIRASTGLTQSAFSETYGIPYSSLVQWEQGKRTPSTLAVRYLELIACFPTELARLNTIRG